MDFLHFLNNLEHSKKSLFYKHYKIDNFTLDKLQDQSLNSSEVCSSCSDPIQSIFKCLYPDSCGFKFCFIHRYLHNCVPQKSCTVCQQTFSYQNHPFNFLPCQYPFPCQGYFCRNHFKHSHSHPNNNCSVCATDLVLVKPVKCNYTYPCSRLMCNNCQKNHTHSDNPPVRLSNTCSLCNQENRYIEFCNQCTKKICLNCQPIHKHPILTTSTSSQECSICYENASMKTTCNHFFHEHCFANWHDICKKDFRDLSCPKCRCTLETNQP